MDHQDFVRGMAKHLTMTGDEAGMEIMRAYFRNWPSLQYVQEGVSAAERELRRRAGLPVGLPPIEGGGVAARASHYDRPHRTRGFTPAQMA